MVRKDYDETLKIVEQTKVEDMYGEMISLEQKVTYIEKDGETRVYTSVGTGDVIEVLMPDAQKLDVEYAKDSLDGVVYNKVIVGVQSDTGVLVIPEETVPLLVDYGYCVSVSNKEMRVVLDEDIVSELSTYEGTVILSIEPADSTNMNPTQARVVADSFAVSILLKVNGETVTELDGDADVTLVPGYVSVDVFRVNADGSLEHIDSNYDQETGKLTFTLQHLSIYMVKAESAPQDNTLLYVGIAAALIIVALIVIAVILLRRRDRS